MPEPFRLEFSPLFRRGLAELPMPARVAVIDALAASGDPAAGLSEHPACPGHTHLRCLRAAGCAATVAVGERLLVLEAVWEACDRHVREQLEWREQAWQAVAPVLDVSASAVEHETCTEKTTFRVPLAGPGRFLGLDRPSEPLSPSRPRDLALLWLDQAGAGSCWVRSGDPRLGGGPIPRSSAEWAAAMIGVHLPAWVAQQALEDLLELAELREENPDPTPAPTTRPASTLQIPAGPWGRAHTAYTDPRLWESTAFAEEEVKRFYRRISWWQGGYRPHAASTLVRVEAARCLLGYRPVEKGAFHGLLDSLKADQEGEDTASATAEYLSLVGPGNGIRQLRYRRAHQSPCLLICPHKEVHCHLGGALFPRMCGHCPHTDPRTPKGAALWWILGGDSPLRFADELSEFILYNQRAVGWGRGPLMRRRDIGRVQAALEQVVPDPVVRDSRRTLEQLSRKLPSVDFLEQEIRARA